MRDFRARARAGDTAVAVGSLSSVQNHPAVATGESLPPEGDTRRKPKRKRPEDAIQRAIVQMLRVSRTRGVIFFAIPNGGLRAHIESKIMKGLGTLKGVPDLCVVAPGGRAHFIEVKAPRGRLEPEQRAFETDCARNEIPHAVVRSLDEAIAVLDGWGLTRARIMAGGRA